MSCPFDPASEDVADFIASYYNLDQPVIPIPDDSCSFFLTDTLGIIYMPLSEAEPITIERHTYNGIPKLYTPLDISAAEAAGFLSTFSQPALSQRGAGTLIGIVDTGIDYTDPIFKTQTKPRGSWASGIRRSPTPAMKTEAPSPSPTTAGPIPLTTSTGPWPRRTRWTSSPPPIPRATAARWRPSAAAGRVPTGASPVPRRSAFWES